MKQPSRNLRNLADDFVIPAGSQVVLLETQASESESNSANNRPFKKPGTVGVVVKCPPHNGQPYLVRFADESEIEIPFGQLALRRREIENILDNTGQEDFSPYIIYRCKVGSKAFGLDNEDSDDDLRGVSFLRPIGIGRCIRSRSKLKSKQKLTMRFIGRSRNFSNLLSKPTQTF